MIAYNNPVVKLMDNPAGIDAQIQAVQLVIAEKCPWLSVVYGRAFRQEDTAVAQLQSTRHRVYYPECYQAGMEPINVMPNDNVDAQLFFYTRDPRVADNAYEPNELNLYTHRVSLIVWAQLKKVFGAGTDQRRTEELIRDVIDALRVQYAVKVTDVYEEWENIYSNYTVLEGYRQYMKPPYTAFRIDFDLDFIEECLT